MDIRSELLDYKSIDEEKYPIPYTYVIKTKLGKSLFYFGANHSTEANNEQYPILKDLWSKFTAENKPEDCVVLMEGGTGRPIYITDEEAIENGCEAGLITKWAYEKRIELYSPEPNTKEIYNTLAKKFSRDEIEYFFFAQVVHQWHSFKNKIPEFENYIKGFLDMDKRESGWLDYDFTLEHMMNIHREILQKEFDLNDKDLFYQLSNPYENKSVINQVGHEANFIREESIVNGILKYALLAKSIFVVYGSAHAIVEEKLLRENL